jgi:hypothetical protein
MHGLVLSYVLRRKIIIILALNENRSPIVQTVQVGDDELATTRNA